MPSRRRLPRVPTRGPRRARERLAAPGLIGLVLLASLACASAPPLKGFAELPPADELYAEGLQKLGEGHRLWLFDTTDYQGAIECFQDIIDNYPYSDYAILAELRIADAFYAQSLFEEALTYYRDFGDLHPGHERVPYTRYRAALAHYRRAEDPSRDQTATRQAVAQIELLMREHPHSAEAREAEPLWRELRTRLGEHVLGIGDFYLGREEYQSAVGRYRSVLNEYPGLGLDAEALYKLGLCYDRMNREDDAMRIFQVILENYQDSEIAKAAQDFIPAAR